MSNWSAVSVWWSAVDDGPSSEMKGPMIEKGHRERLRAVSKTAGLGPLESWRVTSPCPEDDAPGGACVFVATTHANHFNPAGLVAALLARRWEYPESVCVVWCNEDMDLPVVEKLPAFESWAPPWAGVDKRRRR